MPKPSLSLPHGQTPASQPSRQQKYIHVYSTSLSIHPSCPPTCLSLMGQTAVFEFLSSLILWAEHLHLHLSSSHIDTTIRAALLGAVVACVSPCLVVLFPPLRPFVPITAAERERERERDGQIGRQPTRRRRALSLSPHPLGQL